jgi:hypothetical protein
LSHHLSDLSTIFSQKVRTRTNGADSPGFYTGFLWPILSPFPNPPVRTATLSLIVNVIHMNDAAYVPTLLDLGVFPFFAKKSRRILWTLSDRVFLSCAISSILLAHTKLHFEMTSINTFYLFYLRERVLLKLYTLLCSSFKKLLQNFNSKHIHELIEFIKAVLQSDVAGQLVSRKRCKLFADVDSILMEMIRTDFNVVFHIPELGMIAKIMDHMNDDDAFMPPVAIFRYFQVVTETGIRRPEVFAEAKEVTWSISVSEIVEFALEDTSVIFVAAVTLL